MQVKELADQVITAVKAFVAQSVGALSARIEQFEAQIKALPAPLNGEPGKDGAPGKDGRNAYEVAVSLGFEGTVHDWMKSLDGKDGRDGIDGTHGAQGVDGQPGDPGADGENGKDSTVTVEDFRPLVEAETAKALLDFERRAQDVLLKAISNIPAPKDGRDGADGLGFDDMEVTHDGERTFTLKYVRDEVTKEFTFKIPALLERGVYRQGQSYEKGDCVSFGGSLWIAQKDTGSKPETDDTWRLAVKRGRDGKDAVGIKGDKGEPGKNGRDLTQLGQDGAKW